MALLRSCGKLVRAFSKLPVSCQIDYIRNVVCITHKQGYVTVAPKPSYSNTNFEKIEFGNDSTKAKKNDAFPKLKSETRKRLLSLCRDAKDGRLSNADLLQLLECSSDSSDSPNKEKFGLSLLRNCGDTLYVTSAAERRNIVCRIWEVIQENGPSLSLEHYNTLLKVHIENNQTVDPKEFLKDMIVKPNATTYILLLELMSKNGDVDSAQYMFSKLNKTGVKSNTSFLNEKVFNFLIETHANNGDIELALSVLETMKKSGVEPSDESYTRIACGYAKMGDIKNTMKILNEYPLKAEYIIEIVKQLSRGGLGKHISEVLEFLPLTVNEHSSIIFFGVKSMIHLGCPEEAFRVIDHLVKSEPTDDTKPVYEAFLKHLVYAKIPNDTILEFANKILIEKKYPFALAHVAKAALMTGKADLAFAVFELMREHNIAVRPHYYWPLLAQTPEMNGEVEVFRILKHMRCLNVKLDEDVLQLGVLPYINTSDPPATLRKLLDTGLETSQIFTPFICYLLTQSRLKDTLTLLHRLKSPIDFSKIMRPLLTAYKSTKNITDCAKIFKFAPPDDNYPDEFLNRIFDRNSGTADHAILNEFCRTFQYLKIPVKRFSENVSQKNREKTTGDDDWQLVSSNKNNPSRIPHPSVMNLEQLECHLIELRAKGMNYRGILRKLLQQHCRSNNADRVEEIKKEYEENGYAWTPGMYSSLLDLYARTGKLLEALRLYHHLKNNYPEFRVDDYKVVQLADFLIAENHLNEAIELLQSSRSSGTFNTSKNCWQLLNSLAHGPNSELTESILDILVNNGYCERKNVVLGPVVRQYLVKNDLVTAVDFFKNCVERYKVTPLRQELIYALVESLSKNAEMKVQSMQFLEEIMRISADIHGSVSVNTDLLLALAKNGMVDDLRRFFQDHKISTTTLMNSITHVKEENKAKILMTILDTAGEAAGVDRLVLCDHILASYSRLDDGQGTIELWKKITAYNIKTTKRFKKRLVSLLKYHKIPLPKDLRESEV